MHFMLCCIRNHIHNVMSGWQPDYLLLSNQINKVLNNIKWIMECSNVLIGKHTFPTPLDYVVKNLCTNLPNVQDTLQLIPDFLSCTLQWGNWKIEAAVYCK